MEDQPKKRGRPAKSSLVICEVLRGFWPEEGVRVRKGEIVEVTPEQAMDGLESGMLKRVK